MLRYTLSAVVFGLGLSSVSARIRSTAPPIPVPIAVSHPDVIPVQASTGATLPPYNTTYYFEQLIDHNDTSLGTFQQRYWMTWEFYEEGGPIVFFTPGEANAEPYTGYLTNETINGEIAQANNGATIVLEHRFYGLSNPYPNLNVSSLQYHTIPQAIADLDYFARTAVLPMPGGDSVSAPDQAPWVLVGGSYSGALTSWTKVAVPDTFWIGYASSAVVESIIDYWGYFEPIRQFMPKNCSADVEAVIALVDEVFTGDNQTAIDALKANWGLENMTHLDDVAGALRNNLWDWQSLSPDSGNDTLFFKFCDALEVDANGTIAGAEGFGVDHAVTAWGSFWNTSYYANLCGDDNAEDCLGTYNASSTYYTDTEVDNAGRSWTWITCTEVGFFQEGAPEGYPTIVTRLVQPPYDERQCQLMFPEAFPTPPTPDVDLTNVDYEGWNVTSDRLFFANGQRDPWREATVSADNVTRASTDSMPIAIGDGFHCSDLIVANAEVDETVLAVQQEALGYIATWLGEWTNTTSNSTEKRSEKREYFGRFRRFD